MHVESYQYIEFFFFYCRVYTAIRLFGDLVIFANTWAPISCPLLCVSDQ